ncbi:diguanylate cyclase (GGDEF)-like protein [Thermovibrio guaymasensis]|uniref:diguanylate cyclase n=1 Tax=Thermovibrio guaymasensis TaxID=240167 RepID=A0A420W8R2_9BACT|nr:GGDEF domain-containing protein [Thermovibrio guaymasensis]RKQ63697.1 diguanylate cyclase (GGDEF)-like protein [Thermovibrio guaymasensis]
MVSFRRYVLQRVFVVGFILFTITVLFSYFSAKAVREVYYKNLIYLSNLIETNFQILFDLYSNERFIKYQLSETVLKIPELEGIYIEHDGRKFVFPDRLHTVVREIKKDNACSKLSFCKDFIVVCLPFEEKYASVFVESKKEGRFVTIFNRSQERKFVYDWMANVLILTFVFTGFGFLLISSIWGEVGENLFKLHRLISVIEKSLSEGRFLVNERKIGNLLNRFSIKEFETVASLILYLVNRVNSLNEEIEKLAIMDPLTSLYNRNYLRLFVEEKFLPLWKRKKFPISVAMLDLDNFKKINDTYGHQKGDEVLRKWAQIIKSELRKADIPVRFGGEEILIIFPYSRKEEAFKALERIRKKLLEVDFGIGRRVSFSGGVVGYPDDLDNIDSLDDLIKIADERLYKAKRLGKNRIVLN